MNNTQYNKLQFLIAIGFGYFTFGAITNVAGAIIPKIRDTYQVSSTMSAVLAASFFIAYGLTSLPWGMFISKKGKKSALITSIVITIAGVILFASVPGFITNLISMFLCGVGVTGIQVVLNPLVADISDPAKYSRNLTTFMVVMGAGSYAAPQVVTFMKSLGLSWNYTYWVFAVLAVILLVAMQMQTFPGKSAQTEGISAAGDSQESNSVIALLKQPKIYFYALGIFLYVGVEVGIANTIAFYLEDRFAISSMLGEQAELVKNTTISNYWLGLLLGRLISSSFLDKISGRLAIKIYISLATVALYFATHTENLTVALWAFPVIAFFLSIMFPTIYSMTNNRFPKKYSDAISSVLCTAIIGGACIGPAIAWLAESTSVTNTPNWNTGLYIAYACFAYLFIVSLAPNDKG